jgi:CBS domain containing-hemolysin-like protein
MTLLIFFFLVSIIFSFLCSIWEAVLLSVSPSFIETQRQQGTATGKILTSFNDNIDRPLAAILTLNTIAHTVGAIGVGAQAGKVWGDQTWAIWGFALNVEAVIAALMTLAILILSEIIPKTIGANNWKNLAGITARSVNVITYALWPLVRVAQWITSALKKDKARSVFTRGDISAMASIGVKTGNLSEDEYRLLQNVLTFKSVSAKKVMTPRTVVQAADESITIQDFYDSGIGGRHSRIPIFKENIDDVTGYILKHQANNALIDGHGDDKLFTIGRPLLFVEEGDTISHALELMRKNKEHLLRVVDQFGGTAGIISMEDIVETLLGLEILDELDVTADLQDLAKRKWEQAKTKDKK